MTTKDFYFLQKELIRADSFQKQSIEAAFELVYGETYLKIEEFVKVPALYNIWLAGTNINVTPFGAMTIY